MQHYIETTLGCNVQTASCNLPKGMPQHLINDYTYTKFVIENQICLFVQPFEFSLAAYKKQHQKIKQLTNMHVVLHLKSITPYQRKALIEEHLPFVVEYSQIYLPFLAICLVEKYQEIDEIEKFTPITQLVFLYLFYSKEEISATDLAYKINCTPMSVTRAYKALITCGLFSPKSLGVKKHIVAKHPDEELLRRAENFFINPVEKTIYVKNSVEPSQYVVSGIYALSQKTMLNATEYDLCYAIHKKTRIDLLDVTTKAAYFSGKVTAIERWSYDPSILATDNIVDDISLILTLKDHSDERVQIELDRLRSKYKW